jgi:hypothetical protein
MALAKQHTTKIIERIPIIIKGMLENPQAFCGVAQCSAVWRSVARRDEANYPLLE